jgi:hypothetical protein
MATEESGHEMTELYKLLHTTRPDVDLHEFATKYVDHVEATGLRPDVETALWHFQADGSI